MGDTITFAPNTGANPVFSGRGSSIQNPDILPIFWGPYWPGVGELTVDSVMQALNALVAGAYLSGLTQYGFAGPARVRPPRVDRTSNGITLPATGLGVNQVPAVDTAVDGYIGALLGDSAIDDVDDNHELTVLVFLDPSVPQPTITDGVGNVTTVSGDNGKIEEFEFLDDNTRFQRCWIATTGQQLAAVTKTMSHELVESISDPFNSGWHQTVPPPGANAGQIGDVCNQLATSDGVTVSAYWSVADAACIVPTTRTRRVTVSQTATKHQPVDGPPKQGFVDLGVLCGGARMFDYFERTYANALTIDARLDGFDSPLLTWDIDGTPVSILGGSVSVAASWVPEPPPAPGAPAPAKPNTALLSTLRGGPASLQISIEAGPNAGNTSFRVNVSVTESFDTAAASGRGSTLRRGFVDIDLKGQEIVWGPDFTDAHENCERMKHLFDGNGVVIGPPRPGDPANLADRVAQVLRDRSVQRAAGLSEVADLVADTRPELAATLMGLAQRGNR